MRLRSLRMEVDVKLALGEFTLEQAAKYLEEKVPMDPATARQEAIAFSTAPGQAISYQIGKLQIIEMLAEARLQEGRNSTCARSTTSSGRMATCLFRCSAGNISARRTKGRNSRGP